MYWSTQGDRHESYLLESDLLPPSCARVADADATRLRRRTA